MAKIHFSQENEPNDTATCALKIFLKIGTAIFEVKQGQPMKGIRLNQGISKEEKKKERHLNPNIGSFKLFFQSMIFLRTFFCNHRSSHQP